MTAIGLEQRNQRIDSLRGWGCLCIVILHVFANYIHHELSPVWSEPLRSFGNKLICIFFCISGYLIYQSLESLYQTEKNYKFIFYIRRSFRILPIWWLLLTALYLRGSFPVSVYMSNLFFYFGFLSHDPAYLPIEPAWSLFVEEIFYLFLPWTHRLLSSFSKTSFFFALSVVVGLYWRKHAAEFGVPTQNNSIDRGIIVHLPFFVSGIWIVHLERLFKNQVTLKQSIKSYAMSAVGLFSFYGLVVGNYFHSLLVVPLFFIVNLSPKNIFSWSENISFLRFAGQRCYAIYLFHAPIIDLCGPLLHFLKSQAPAHLPEIGYLLSATLIVVLTTLAATISHLWIEQPLIRYGYSLSKRWKATNSASRE